MQTGTTMMLVSHDLEEAVYLADQVLLLTKRPTRDRRDPALRRPAPAHRRDAVRAELHRRQEAQPGDLPARSAALARRIHWPMEQRALDAYVDAACRRARPRARAARRARARRLLRSSRGIADDRWQPLLAPSTLPAPSVVPIAPDDLDREPARRREPRRCAGSPPTIAARCERTSARGGRRGEPRRIAAIDRAINSLHRRHRRSRARRSAAPSMHGAPPATRAARRSPACRSRSRTCSTSPA